MERLTGHEDYEELSNEPAFSKMVKEWKAYRSTGLSPADIPALTARAEAAEARADAAIEDLRQNGFCGSCSGCNAPHYPNNITWCYSWEWRGQQEAGKGDSNANS